MELRPPLYYDDVAIEKGAFKSPLTKVAKFIFSFIIRHVKDAIYNGLLS